MALSKQSVMLFLLMVLPQYLAGKKTNNNHWFKIDLIELYEIAVYYYGG